VGFFCQSQSVVNAIKCLDSQFANDTYTLALMAYAYTLYDVNYPRRQEVMGILESKAIYKGNSKLDRNIYFSYSRYTFEG